MYLEVLLFLEKHLPKNAEDIELQEQCGYIRKEYLKCNRKTAHLRICKGAMGIIHDGQAAQEEFISIMLDGFSQEEIDSMKKQNDRILCNINAYLKGKETE